MRALSWVLRLVTVAGLAFDAYVHLSLASVYDQLKATVSQGLLFRIEGIAAAVVALLLLVTGARLAWVLAFLVAAAGTAAVLVYRYVDIGAFGPFPAMTEGTWFPQGDADYRKIASVIAEGVAALVALIGIFVGTGRRRVREVSNSG